MRSKTYPEILHHCYSITNFIKLNRLYTTQLTVVNLQLVKSATCFGLIWPSLGLQNLVSIIVHNVPLPIRSHGLHYPYVSH